LLDGLGLPASQPDIEVRLAALAAPSAADVTETLPVSVQSVAPGSNYFVEVWIRDLDPASQGIVGGRVELAYDTQTADAIRVEHGGLYTELFSGSIHDRYGRVEDLGGGTLASQAAVGKWARLGIVELLAAESGYNTVSLAPGSLEFARAQAGGDVDWSRVDLGQTVTVAHPGLVPVNLRVVFEPTAGEENGEIENLPPFGALPA
jgi:hypothetical protein